MQHLRQYPISRSKTDSRKIEGYAIKFYDPNDPGTEYERAKGVFERILPGTPITFDHDTLATFNHNVSQPLGRTGNKTLAYHEDRVGIHYSIQLPDTSLARDLQALVDRGDVSGSSFSGTVKERFVREGNKQVVYLDRIHIHELGPATMGAYSSTEAYVRSLEEAEKKNRHDYIKRRLRIIQLTESNDL